MPAPPPGGLRYRLAFYAVASIVLMLVVMLPFAATSLFDDLFHSMASQVFTLVGERPPVAAQGQSQVHVGIVDLDESRLRIRLRVTAHRDYATACQTGARIVLFPVGTDEAATAGMPPSAYVDLAGDQAIVSQSIDLPIHGHSTLYPYEVYVLRLGVGLGELVPIRPVRPLTRAEGQERLC